VTLNAVTPEELFGLAMDVSWPETCWSCGADLVTESWVEIAVRGPVTVASILPGGQLDTVHTRQEPNSAGVRMACGNCLADITDYATRNRG